MKVIAGGLQTLTEDWPGRTGYHKSGVALAGVVDHSSHGIGNLLVGNPIGEVGLEISGGFFKAEFTEDTVIAITGADMKPTINNEPAPMWESIRVSKGDKINFGACKEFGFVSYLALAGGINLPLMWGSKSTCTKEGYGGFKGRKLQAGDELELGKSAMRLSDVEGRKFKKDLIPKYSKIWEIRAMPGPQSAPDYFTEEGMELWFSQPWQIDHNSNRSAYRLRHAKPIFARTSGGMGGGHPSNVQIQAYRTPGTLNVCGDFGIILFVDGVALGGYVCALTIILADLWKVGQAVPLRDSIKFVYCTVEEAREALIKQDALFTAESLE